MPPPLDIHVPLYKIGIEDLMGTALVVHAWDPSSSGG